MMKNADEPMLDPQGDIGLSRHLSKALRILTESPIDADLRRQLREILRGEGSIRDLATSEPFQRLSESIAAKGLADYANQSPEERQRLIEQGNALLERYRHEAPVDDPVPGPTSPPEPTLPTTPTPGSAQSRDSVGHPTGRVVPGTRKPNRDRVVTPDEPDDDDLYYQERRRHGWLEP